MEREDHIDKLRNKLNSQTVISDKNALWNELEPRLPKQKKNRKFILWLPLTGLLFFTTFLVVNYISKKATPQPTQTNQATIAVIDNLNKDISSKRNNIENKKQERNSTSLTSSPNKPPASQNSTASIIKGKTENLKITKNNTLEKSTNESTKANTYKENKPTTYLSNSDKVIDKKDLSQNLNSNKSTTIKTEYEKSIKTVQEPIKEKSDTQKHSNQNKATDKASSKPYLFPTLQKLGIEKMYSSIKKINVPNFVIQKNEKTENDHKWLASINTYALVEYNFKSQDNFTPYGIEINNLTSIMPGYSIGGRLSIKRSSGLFFSLGIEQSKSFEKFKLENSISSMELVINEEAFLFKGQFIANEQEVLKTTKQSVLSYNTYSKTSLMPFVGYTINKKIDYEFAAAPILNLVQNYQGYIIDENQLLISELDHLYRHEGAVLSGYSLSASASKQFKNKINLGICMQFRSVGKNVSKTNSDFNLSLKSLGIGLRLGYALN